MTEQIQPHIMESYQIVKKIGSGAYGHVWKVIDRQTKTVKALKKNFDAFSNSTDSQRTYRQIMFLKQLKHSNIINLQKIIRASNDKDIYLIFEHMDVDLHTLIRQDGKSTNLQERHKQYIIYQIAKSIYYLHNSNLIHRDLKPSNVLINQSCEAKLCDFGLVRYMDEPNDFNLVVMTDYIATRWYRAPQLLLGSQDYNKEVDIWALGCLIGQMFHGKAMFPGTSTINQLQKVIAWTGAPSNAELNHISGKLNNGVLQLFNTRKKNTSNDFFSNKLNPLCLDLIKKLLMFDPKKRLTIQEVLKHEYLSQFYQEKQMKQIKNARAKIQLHINDNTKLNVKDYRQLIYSEINPKSKVLSNYNQNNRLVTENSNNTKSKLTKVDESKLTKKEALSKDKSRNKPSVIQYTQSGYSKSQTIYQSQSTEGKQESRKEAKSSMQKSEKSKTLNRKKGISLCSKSISKQKSLSKKKNGQLQTADSRQVINRYEQIKKIKPYSRSCSQKYDKVKRMITQQIPKNYKRVMLTDCFVNENIGKKINPMNF